jgi:hypothetical protein
MSYLSPPHGRSQLFLIPCFTHSILEPNKCWCCRSFCECTYMHPCLRLCCHPFVATPFAGTNKRILLHPLLAPPSSGSRGQLSPYPLRAATAVVSALLSKFVLCCNFSELYNPSIQLSFVAFRFCHDGNGQFTFTICKRHDLNVHNIEFLSFCYIA